jgi:hypothetical protein
MYPRSPFTEKFMATLGWDVGNINNIWKDMESKDKRDWMTG